jgi:hypothetical protein
MEPTYTTGLASLFSVAARVERFVYHYDRPNQQWNVFKVIGGRENYICSFSTSEAANAFCKSAMEVGDVSN